MKLTPPPFRPSRIALVAIGVVAIIATYALWPRHSQADPPLPKDVAYTPAASPLASPPPEVPLATDAVSVSLSAGAPVGPNTLINGTAVAPDGVVQYRITDYRSGQVAAGEQKIEPGARRAFSFAPAFTRPYTKSDPAALDVWVVNPDGTERTTRVTITLQ